MTAEEIRCPFGPCEARFDAPQQYLSGPRGGVMLDYVPNHQFVPDAWFGGCPASAMQLPIAEYERDALREQERNHARIAASKVPRLREQVAPAPDTAPRERPAMFRPTSSQGSRDLGPQALPKLLDDQARIDELAERWLR